MKENDVREKLLEGVLVQSGESINKRPETLSSQEYPYYMSQMVLLQAVTLLASFCSLANDPGQIDY